MSIFKCVQDATGTYELEWACSSTCYDATVFDGYATAADSDGTSTTDSSSSSGAATEDRFVCSTTTQQCKRESFPRTATMKANHYKDGVACNTKVRTVITD